LKGWNEVVKIQEANKAKKCISHINLEIAITMKGGGLMSIDDKKQCLGWVWTALVVFASLSIIFYFCLQKLNMTLGLCIIIFLAFSAIFTFIKIFTDIIPFGRNDCEEAQNLIRRWMIYAYAFMVFSLAISILPFMTKIDSIFNQTGRPVSLVNGCIESTDTANQLLLCKPEKNSC
jgi:hypothetical protein